MAASPLLAALVALVAWWASPGLLLVMVRRGERAEAPHWPVLGALPLLVLGVAGYVITLPLGGVGAAYGAFFSALAIWGWLELAFLAGVITGPVRAPARAGVPEWERFIRAWGTIAHHEMALTFTLIALGLLAFASPDTATTVGFWTFALLWTARISAKLNLYLGVRKVNTEFIPAALAHLPSHFREARLNALFPTSVTLLTVAVAYWGGHAVAAETGAAAVGHALLAAMAALALLEHWLMVVRLPDEKLWRWMLPEPHETRDTTGAQT
jgi:putative photosynthetic complex assembly protein 2